MTLKEVENAPKSSGLLFSPCLQARLAQSAERKALNLVVVGSSPMVGVVALWPRFLAVGICHWTQAGLILMWSWTSSCPFV